MACNGYTFGRRPSASPTETYGATIMKHVTSNLTIIVVLLAVAGCMGKSAENGFMYKNLPVADGSAVAGEGQSVLFKGNPLMLSGNGIKVGDQLRDVKVAQGDLALVNIAHTKGEGKVRIISVVPS